MTPDCTMIDRRRASLLLLTAALGGCASRPAPRVATQPPGADSGFAYQAPAFPAAPTRPPLDLDPAERDGVVALTMLLINTPYTYGGNTPRGGFDCSGLISYVFSQIDGRAHRLPRTTAQWAATSVPVDSAAMARGDLVFFNTSGARFSHMGLYVGKDEFVHAPSTGGTVRQASLRNRYFATRYEGARRVFAA